jgi:hypothetical protein
VRTCVIHIGLHKTATTSIQQALTARRQVLQDRDFLYVAAGSSPLAKGAHANLAWEISADPRFGPEYGTVEDLIAEISDAPEQHILVSSEDFACAVHNGPRFRAFIQRLQSAALQVSIVVYLRDQADYVVSLYLEMLRQGLDQTFTEFLKPILADGRFEWRAWIFPFDYDKFLARLEALGGVRVIVRPYENSNGATPVADFLSLLGLNPADLGVDSTLRLNQRPAIAEAAGLFYANRTGTPLDAADRAAIEALFGLLGQRSLPIARESALKIANRFRESNARVAARHGFDPGERAWEHMPVEPAGRVTMDSAFRWLSILASKRGASAWRRRIDRLRTIANLRRSPGG